MRFNTNNYKDVRAFSENQYLDVLASYPDEGFENYSLNEDEGTFEGEYDVNADCPRANVIEYLFRYDTALRPQGE